MIIYLGSDNRGHYLKEKVFAYLSKYDYKVRQVGRADLGADEDYPHVAQVTALKVVGSESSDARGVLICGSSQGMAMASNRFAGIRAVVAWDAYEAKISRDEVNSNVLCIPAREFEDNPEAWQGVIETWLATPFSNATRFKRQIAQMDEV